MMEIQGAPQPWPPPTLPVLLAQCVLPFLGHRGVMPFLVVTHVVVSIPSPESSESEELLASTTQTEHDTFAEAQRAGMQMSCVGACVWVEVYGPDGTLECSWRRSDPFGERDNQWHALGPHALQEKRKFQERMFTELRDRSSGRT